MFRSGVFIYFIFSLFLAGTAWGDNTIATPSFEDKQFVIDERAAIQRASAAWAEAMNQHHPIQAAALYANQISLYATFEAKIDNYNDLLKYFTMLCKKPDFKVVLNEEDIRIYGPTAINSGVYTFSYRDKDETIEIPARFTFVYALTPAGWKIVEHHSSVLPE